MAGRRPERRLATVLFLDIVDSTRIAGEVGDRRWRDLLREFRHLVRQQLRAHRGHEEDTAGDGFFTTFGRPASAIRAAARIVAEVHRLGLDVRCGIHTGELERIDGRLGGIAAHIGARVMAQAMPAQVFVTATVRDLVVGGGISFEPAQETELKGIPGSWALHRVVDVDGLVIPPPLKSLEASGIRTGRQQPPPGYAAAPRPIVIGLALAGGLAIAALGAVILTLPRDAPSIAAGPSASPLGPPTMLKIDPETNAIEALVHDRYLPLDGGGVVLIVDGTLWQETPINLVRRDLETGEAIDVIDKPSTAFGTWVAFGSVWFEIESHERLQRSDLHRLDPISGRTLAVIPLEPPLRGVAFGRDAIYALTREAEILEVDPDANAVVDVDRLPIETIPDAVVSVGRRRLGL